MNATQAMNPAPTEAAAVPVTTLHYLPVGLFGAVMGNIGLAVAWRLAASRYGAPAEPPLPSSSRSTAIS